MRFPLDLVFLDFDLRPVALRSAVPPSARRLRAPRPSGARASGRRPGRRRIDAAASSRPRRSSSARTTLPTLELLCDHLEADRFRALPAPSASDALRLCHYKQPDLLLLDLRLPDAPGLDVLHEIRAAERRDRPLRPGAAGDRAQRPRHARRTGCAGFAEGADDYVVKPFHYAEVAARIRAVLRRRDGAARRTARGSATSSSILPGARSGWATRRVPSPTRSSRCSARSPAEPRRVFTKEELLRDVWGFRSMGRTRTLDSHASRLRRKLDPDAGAYVINVWGIGYRLIDR